MPEVVIADASCLIYLTNLGELELLRGLYAQVWVTPTVATEYQLPLPEWMGVRAPREAISTLIFGARLDDGEASAIALALELPGSLINTR